MEFGVRPYIYSVTSIKVRHASMGSDRVRVASYNIRKAIGSDGRRDPQRIQSIIKAIGADVVALQEGDFRFRGRAALFDPDELHRLTGLHAVDLNHDAPGLGWHGNVLLLGPDARATSVRTIDLPGLEPRGAVTVHLEIGDKPLQIIAGHLGLLAYNRKRQVRMLLDAIDASDDVPVIAMGDFNGWGRAPGSLRPLRDMMNEVTCGPSYPARWPVTPLDRLFYHGALIPTASGVWRESPAQMASDHLPIWAEFERANPASA